MKEKKEDTKKSEHDSKVAVPDTGKTIRIVSDEPLRRAGYKTQNFDVTVKPKTVVIAPCRVTRLKDGKKFEFEGMTLERRAGKPVYIVFVEKDKEIKASETGKGVALAYIHDDYWKSWKV